MNSDRFDCSVNVYVGFHGLYLVGGEQDGKTMLSQGKKEIRGKDVFFQSEQPLSGLSLCIEEYRSLEMEEEGISFFLYYLPWNQFVIGMYTGMETMREVLENPCGVWKIICGEITHLNVML